MENSKEALKKRADARFKKDERVREGTKAMLDYEAEGRAVREKTARLKKLRLDKEAAEKNEGAAADSRQPLITEKKGEPWLLVVRIRERNRGWRRLHGKITISA
jgi:hypothetical protein